MTEISREEGQRIFNIIRRALETYAPGLTDTTRVAIATSVTIQLTRGGKDASGIRLQRPDQ